MKNFGVNGFYSEPTAGSPTDELVASLPISE
jgi:hypothetical protein